MQHLSKIALLIGKNIGYSRDVIEGIYAFSQRKKNWVFHDAAPSAASIQWVSEWEPDGIIGHFYDPAVAAEISKLNVPIVNTTDTLTELNMPLADVNQFQVGKMAGEYLRDLGLKHFGYLGSATTQYSKQRLQAFRGVIGRDALLDVCHVEYLPRIVDFSILRRELEKIKAWVAALPKPVGVFCSNDVPARDLADACLELGISVPHEVAILGVDNDLVECRLSRPPLSSIEIPSAGIGYGAAQMLSDLIEGRSVSHDGVYTPSPIRVVERESTDMNAVQDKHLAKALSYIDENIATLGTINEIVAQVPLSRRSLELKAKELLGKSLLEVIQQKRIRHATGLLLQKNATVAEVAEACGFSNSRRFSETFKEIMGESPSTFQKTNRRSGF